MRRFTTLLLLTLVLASHHASASTVLFKAPNTQDGWMGKVGLVAHGELALPTGLQLKPEVQWRTINGSLWSEEVMDMVTWDGQRTRPFLLFASINSAPYWSSEWSYNYASFWMAPSVDGKAFPRWAWREIFWTNPETQNIRPNHLSVWKISPGRYHAFFPIIERTGSSLAYWSAKAELDLDQLLYRVRVTTCIDEPTCWSSWVPWGTQLRTDLEQGPGSNHRLAQVGGGFELWNAKLAPRSGAVPCTGGVPTDLYISNTQEHTGGRQLGSRTYSWDSNSMGPFKATQGPASALGHTWTDYGGSALAGSEGIPIQSIIEPFTATLNDGTRFVYYGSTDLSVCKYPRSTNPWKGSGVKVLRVEQQANGSYFLRGMQWLTNLRYPNWTCAPGVPKCYAPKESRYAFVSAQPVVPEGSGEVFFYVPVWEGFSFR